MTLKERNRILEHALINIIKCGGKCWDGERVCHDPQGVAHYTLMKTSKRYKRLADEQCDLFDVERKLGRVTFKGKALR